MTFFKLKIENYIFLSCSSQKKAFKYHLTSDPKLITKFMV